MTVYGCVLWLCMTVYCDCVWLCIVCVYDCVLCLCIVTVLYRCMFVVAECGGVLTAATYPQTIESPGYSRNQPYQEGQECTWYIKVSVCVGACALVCIKRWYIKVSVCVGACALVCIKRWYI